MKTSVAVLDGFGEPLDLREVDVPPLKTGQVLIRVAAAGVCGSDVHMWRGLDPRTPLPIILGHEGVGWVEEMGGERKDVHGDRVSPGDLVTWERGVTCGRCYYCAVLGDASLCENRWVYGIYRPLTQEPFLNGCYAQHIILDARTHLIPLQREDDPAVFAAATCSGATAAHALDLADVAPGDTVVIMGPGPLGAFAAALARAQGAEHVPVVGGTHARLELCQRLGATLALDRHAMSEAERIEAIMTMTHGRGADLVIEASGSLAAAREALGYVRYGGTLSLVGFGAPVGELSIAPFEQIVRKNVQIQGVWVSELKHTLRAVSLVRQAPDRFAGLVTHRFRLTDATEALAAVETRDALKAVIEPWRE